ncbi:hypothetical protein SEEM1594_00849, partial [Salmonella enterica subsp. enterica serovar Muenchen str. baa1594]
MLHKLILWVTDNSAETQKNGKTGAVAGSPRISAAADGGRAAW